MKSLIKKFLSFIIKLSNNIEENNNLIYKRDYRNRYTGYRKY